MLPKCSKEGNMRRRIVLLYSALVKSQNEPQEINFSL